MRTSHKNGYSHQNCSNIRPFSTPIMDRAAGISLSAGSTTRFQGGIVPRDDTRSKALLSQAPISRPHCNKQMSTPGPDLNGLTNSKTHRQPTVTLTLPLLDKRQLSDAMFAILSHHLFSQSSISRSCDLSLNHATYQHSLCLSYRNRAP